MKEQQKKKLTDYFQASRDYDGVDMVNTELLLALSRLEVDDSLKNDPFKLKTPNKLVICVFQIQLERMMPLQSMPELKMITGGRLQGGVYGMFMGAVRRVLVLLIWIANGLFLPVR